MSFAPERLPSCIEAVFHAVSALSVCSESSGSRRRGVVVLGSAPAHEESFRLAARIGIFVNGALEHSREVESDSAIWVLSSPLLNVGLSKIGLDRFVSVPASHKAREIKSLRCNLAVVVAEEIEENVVEGLKALEVHAGQVIVLPPTVTAELALKLLGWQWFLTSISSWYVFRRLLGALRKSLASASLASFRLPGNLRPSTGIFAMVLASYLFPSEEKTFHGIEPSESTYQIGGRIYDFRGEPGNSFRRPRNHLPADAEILRALQRSFDWSDSAVG